MTTTPEQATETTRLPATLEPAPASVARWTIKKHRKFRAIEWDGYEATVAVDGRVVGHFQNDGNGGGSMFAPTVPGAYDLLEALLREWAVANPACAMPTSTVVDGVSSEPVPMVLDEHAIDSIVENHVLAKKLDGLVKRGKTPVLTPEQVAAAADGGQYGVMFGIKEWGTFNAPLDAPGLRERIARDGMLAWIDGAWQTPAV